MLVIIRFNLLETAIQSDVEKVGNSSNATNNLPPRISLNLERIGSESHSKNNLPNISSTQVVNLVNSGTNISSLMSSPSNVRNVRNGDGSKYRSPSNYIMEIDFNGKSNIYSPYIYYDKNTSEKFYSLNK